MVKADKHDSHAMGNHTVDLSIKAEEGTRSRSGLRPTCESKGRLRRLTVSEVSRRYGVSARMLRYYEKAGLFASETREGYAYRVYDEEAVSRLEKVLLLRKLSLPLREIKTLLSGGPAEEKAVLGRCLDAAAAELSRLETAHRLLSALYEKGMAALPDLQQELAALPSPGNLLKETAGEVRMVLLPPFRAAAFHVIGPEPEEKAGALASEFVQKSGLYAAKPDARMFGFNHPNPGVLESGYGYEVWVTVPEDFPLPENAAEKRFEGGLYAALTIRFPEFHRWADLARWAETNPRYRLNPSPLGGEVMQGCLEEHLNWVYSAAMGWPADGPDGQVDLLLPVAGAAGFMTRI